MTAGIKSFYGCSLVRMDQSRIPSGVRRQDRGQTLLDVDVGHDVLPDRSFALSKLSLLRTGCKSAAASRRHWRFGEG